MKIKKNVIALSALLAMSFTTTLMAGQVGSITTFSSGTAAVAAEVNGNFTATEIAINDNDARLKKIETGIVSIHASGFHIPSGEAGCVENNGNGFLSTSSGAQCIAIASIQLPDLSKITKLKCSVMDSVLSASTDIFVRVSRNLNTSLSTSGDMIIETPVSSESSSIQVLESNTIIIPDSDLIDNSKYYYHIKAVFTNAGSGVRLYGCSISYTTT